MRMLTSLSKFKNTANDPVLIDIEPETPVESKASIQKIDGSSSVKIVTNPENHGSTSVKIVTNPKKEVNDCECESIIGSTMSAKLEKLRLKAVKRKWIESRDRTINFPAGNIGDTTRENKMSGFQSHCKNANEDVTEIARPRKREKIIVASEKHQVQEKQPHINEGVGDMDPESSHANENKLPTLRTRTSPRVLYDAIYGLNTAQKETVQDMVDALNTKEMHLEVHQAVIPISVESIHKVLGLPIGGINLLELDEEESDKRILKQWKSQFGNKKVRPTDLLDAIQKSTDVGFNFKMNFLVLFVNIMAEGCTMGSRNFKFLARIHNEEMIPKIDWCRYIYTRVCVSKRLWNRENSNCFCFYVGPLTYMTLLYVEETVSSSLVVPNKK